MVNALQCNGKLSTLSMHLLRTVAISIPSERNNYIDLSIFSPRAVLHNHRASNQVLILSRNLKSLICSYMRVSNQFQ